MKSMFRASGVLPFLIVFVACAGCGASARTSGVLRGELQASLEAARERASGVVADAEQALDEADRAEALGDLSAAAEHRARARLLAATATSVARTRELDEAREVLAAETSSLSERALELDASAEALEHEASRRAAAQAAREEALRALTRAEADEASRRRASRLSLDDARALRAAAADLRHRAQLLLSAAITLARQAHVELGAVQGETERLLQASETATEPLEMLRQADAAHDAARHALGIARRGQPVTAERVASLIEACESEGFAAVLVERGVAIDVQTSLGSGHAPSPEGAARLTRLGTLLASYPEGPVVFEVAGSDAEARGSALSRIAREAGVAAERIEVQTQSSGPTSARVMLSAYALPTPAGASRLLGEAPSAGTGIGVVAHPTPDPADE